MNKFLVIVLFIFCQNVFCQEYYFDTFLEYRKSQGANDIFILNSSNQDYVFYCYNNKNYLQGRIVDHKRNVQHYYTMMNHNNTIDFEYLYSKKTDSDKKDCDDVKKENFEINIVVIDSVSQSYQIIEYTNKKKKRIYQNGIVSLKKIDSKDLPCLVYGYFSDFSECIRDVVSFPKGYIPTNIKSHFKNKEITKKKKLLSISSPSLKMQQQLIDPCEILSYQRLL